MTDPTVDALAAALDDAFRDGRITKQQYEALTAPEPEFHAALESLVRHHGRPSEPETAGYWRYDHKCDVTPADHEVGDACHAVYPHSHRAGTIKWARWVSEPETAAGRAREWIVLGGGTARFSRSQLSWSAGSGVNIKARQVVETAPNDGVYMRLASTIEDELLDKLSEARAKALDEVAALVEKLPLYDGQAVTKADAAESMRIRAVVAIDSLRAKS